MTRAKKVKSRKKENPLKDMFGTFKFKKPTKKILKEIRRKENNYI